MATTILTVPDVREPIHPSSAQNPSLWWIVVDAPCASCDEATTDDIAARPV